jgi:signal transduction histidine kinase
MSNSPEATRLSDLFQDIAGVTPFSPASYRYLYAYPPNDSTGFTTANMPTASFAFTPFVPVSNQIAEAMMYTIQNQNERLQQTNQRLVQTAQQLAQRNQVLLELSQAIDTVAENERASVAHELHDAVINPLETQLALLNSKIETGLTTTELQRFIQELSEVRTSLRQGLLNLHAAELREHGLYAAIVYMTKRTAKDQAFKLQLEVSDNLLDYSITDNIQHAVYRITQQALQNIIKHAEAHNVRVSLAVEANTKKPSNSSHALVLCISDDGRGFEVPVDFNRLQVAGHNGLAGFAQKVKLLDGTLQIISQPSCGTTITITIPIL